MKVDTIHSYGDKPDAEEIENSINAAENQGYKLDHTESYGTQIETGKPLHVVILYFREKGERINEVVDKYFE